MNESIHLYRQELLRWNRRFSLLSRRDPERVLDRLLRESTQALDALAAGLVPLDPAAAALIAPRAASPATVAGSPEVPGRSSLPAPAAVVLVDIGSGNGIPGIPWHLELSERLGGRAELWTALVEPRRKRAWFLERIARRLDPDRLRVIEGRWQDGPYTELSTTGLPAPRLWILVARALRLPETELMTSLARHAGPPSGVDRRLTARFEAPGGAADETEGPAARPPARALRLSVAAGEPGVGLLVNWYPPAAPAPGEST